MIIAKTIKALQIVLDEYKQAGYTTGFCPTMGALHRGHISLIEMSRAENDKTVCSIFVNPTQFNNPDDLAKYPVTIEEDVKMLEAAGCDVLFLPTTQEMYPQGEKTLHYQLGELETLLEGFYRPGHFQGVATIVDKLLALVKPTRLYLGQKDFQQVMVVRKMMELRGHKTELKTVPTMREGDGLAMSSRNRLLDPEQRKASVIIYETLKTLKGNLAKTDVRSLEETAKQTLEKNGLRVDYVSVADAATLKPVTNFEKPAVALVAAYMGEVRLIDNILLN